MTRRILRLDEVAAKTRVPLATLRWYRAHGTGPRTWKLAGRVVAYDDDVQRWMDEQERATASMTGDDAA